MTVFPHRGSEVMDPSTLDVGPGLKADSVAAKVREIVRGRAGAPRRADGEVRAARRGQAEFKRAGGGAHAGWGGGRGGGGVGGALGGPPQQMVS